jgi:hypothetical protein
MSIASYLIAMQRKEAVSPTRAASKMRERIRMLAPTHIVHDPPCLLASVRELYSRLPETYYRELWELQHILYSLGYTDELADEAAISAALEVARADFDPEAGAA